MIPSILENCLGIYIPRYTVSCLDLHEILYPTICNFSHPVLTRHAKTIAINANIAHMPPTKQAFLYLLHDKWYCCVYLSTYTCAYPHPSCSPYQPVPYWGGLRTGKSGWFYRCQHAQQFSAPKSHSNHKRQNDCGKCKKVKSILQFTSTATNNRRRA